MIVRHTVGVTDKEKYQKHFIEVHVISLKILLVNNIKIYAPQSSYIGSPHYADFGTSKKLKK